MSLFLNGNARVVTGHSNNSVLEKHYIDPQALIKASQGFKVFSVENNRGEELQQIRNKSTEINKEHNEKQKSASLELE